MTDRTFERIETLFDIALVRQRERPCGGLRLGRRQRRAPACHVRHPEFHAYRQRHPRVGERHPAHLRPTLIGQKKVDAVADVLLDRNPKADITTDRDCDWSARGGPPTWGDPPWRGCAM